MKTLFARVSLAFLAILLLAGGGFYAVERFSTERYYEELTQRLNGSIAMYVTGERTLIENGEVNQEALAQLAQQAMVINPTVEIYLLDVAGNILGHPFPAESLQTTRVDPQALGQLMTGEVKLPFRHTDPRNLAREKVFSAAEVMHDGQLQGYLYAILGGQKYDELASSIRSSYIQQISLGAIAAIIAASMLAGLLVFNLLTRRLTRLTRNVQGFTQSGFDPLASFHVDELDDEIGQLGRAFRRMSDKIGEQFADLKETDRLRRELISNVSHDLRTPLASMMGYVDTLLLKNDELDENQRLHYLEITRKHTLRLDQLVGDLFELSKLDAECVNPALEVFSLAELLQDVSQEFELDAQSAGIRLEFKTPECQAMVRADIGLVQRVLENLLRNALKHTPSGGRVSIQLEAAAGTVKVAVADTGRGIPAADLERIFDRFYRAGEPVSHEDSSTGLGLAIVKRILDLHGSRITVNSQPNQGTRFEFDLPAAA
ncbi:MAG TPA: HAMP domain-containing sensor histidine kinase [Xanthomonadales bacterium]|nr:HAMP domain-containing sensor histidine kinase [Xanthomonadales bacterium]